MPHSTTLDVTVNVNNNPANTEFAIQETGGNYVQANGSLGVGPIWQTATLWGTKTITGLTTGVTYTFQVKARNGDMTETTFSGTASGSPAASPTIQASNLMFTNISRTGHDYFVDSRQRRCKLAIGQRTISYCLCPINRWCYL